MKLKTWTSKDLHLGTRVFLRIDGNVPLKNGRAFDGSRGRLSQTIPEIVKLRAHGARIILATHLGDPGGKVDPKFSVKPVAKLLAQKLGRPIRVLDGLIGASIEREILGADAGEILMIENLRFDPGEEANDPAFAKSLAHLADVYVNNAFGVCHRAHASVAGITKYLPSFAGELVEREIRELDEPPTHPFLLIMGGAKLKTKIPILQHLGGKTDRILLGGAISLPFLLALNRPVPASVKKTIDKEDVRGAERVLRDFMDKLVLPEDLVIDSKGRASDIGLNSIALFTAEIERARSVLWNGPMGIIEEAKGRAGTKAIGRAILKRKLDHSIVGGGDSIEFLESAKLLGGFTHVSTGGGAMLAFLSGEKLPGLEALRV
ncbi:MAG: phosphoglycerate kinase [Patescibacteria group bacterium]|jgi:phosphoglycerate kinase